MVRPVSTTAIIKIFAMENLFLNLLSLLTISSFFRDHFVSAVDSRFEICSVPSSCGNQTISFPFYIHGLQESSCGHPRFPLSCNKSSGTPILNISGDGYIVHEIFYQNRSLHVSNAAFSDPTPGSCTPPLRNLSLPSDLVLAPGQTQVYVVYDCPSNATYMMADYFDYGDVQFCSEHRDHNYSHNVLVVIDDDKDFAANVSGECGTGGPVVVPIHDKNWGFNTTTREMLSRGFLLNWMSGTNCSQCESTGGKCGYDRSSSRFSCYCRDRPHAVNCSDSVPPSSDHFQQRKDPISGHGKSGINLGIKVGAAIAILLAVIGVLIAVILFTLRKKKQNQTKQKFKALLRNNGNPLKYSYTDVKKMTNSFKEKLGEGGFGEVYKGTLENGCLVAVKLLNKSKGEDNVGRKKESKVEDAQEFINEVATISQTSHVNIVSLLGYCFEGAKKALIYEFMPNGSLEKFIFDENATANGHRLDWETHYQISLGIARGLEYLHRGCKTRIVHFDIKPHNILLDADFVPKISDFGLAKICNRKESAVSMLSPRGTRGYVAPEVLDRNVGVVSHKSDVYSYGMMVLEMVGGRRNMNVRVDNTSEIYFPHWIHKRVELDEELGLRRIMNQDDGVNVRRMVIVSLWCIQTDPSSRPAMSKVIEMLEGSLDSLQVPPKP